MPGSDNLSTLLDAATDGAGAVAAVTRAFEASRLHFGHGTDNAADEAAWLFAHVSGIDYADPDWPAAFDRALAAPLADTVRERTPRAARLPARRGVVLRSAL